MDMDVSVYLHSAEDSLTAFIESLETTAALAAINLDSMGTVTLDGVKIDCVIGTSVFGSFLI